MQPHNSVLDELEALEALDSLEPLDIHLNPPPSEGLGEVPIPPPSEGPGEAPYLYGNLGYFLKSGLRFSRNALPPS